jgi:hypothetical protein
LNQELKESIECKTVAAPEEEKKRAERERNLPKLKPPL